MEVEVHIVAHVDLTDAEGRSWVDRHGYSPEREIQTEIGAVWVKAPRVRDRDDCGPDGRIHFTSSVLPCYLTCSRMDRRAVPWLYMKRISFDDFGEALDMLLGPDAPGPDGQH